MRSVSVHPEKSINFTEHARKWCIVLNTYKRLYPDHSFATIARAVGLTEVTARRYYYGIHHYNPSYEMGGRGYSQMRRGACVPIR